MKKAVQDWCGSSVTLAPRRKNLTNDYIDSIIKISDKFKGLILLLNRRFYAVFIAALSVIALLSGCSGENSQPDTSDAVSSAVSDKMDSQTQESPSSEVSDNPDTNQVSMEDLSSASSQSISSAIEESKTQDD